MRDLAKFLVLVAIALIASTTQGRAYQVSPMVMDLKLNEGETTQRIRVHNQEGYDKAIVVSAHRVTLGENGEQTVSRQEAQNLLVFPPQALIRPGAAQSFVLQWVGDPAVRQAETYIIAFKQISIRDPREFNRGALEILVNINAMLSVQPPDVTIARINADVTATARPAVSRDGRPAVELLVTNTGDGNAYVSDADIRLSAGGWRETIDANTFLIQAGYGLVQPRSRRRFILPVTPPPGAGAIRAELSFAQREFRGKE